MAWLPFKSFQRKTNGNVILQTNRADFRPAQFVYYREAILKTHDITRQLENELTKYQTTSILASHAFYILLHAEMRALEYLNDENLNCQVPWNEWNETVGLPSPPSMIADVQKFRSSENNTINLLLNSFLAWTVFAHETLNCVCGASGMESRKVECDMMINHIVQSETHALVIKQLVGMRSSDLPHLQHHYNMSQPSKQHDNLHIVWICENKLSFENGVKVEPLSTKCANTFNAAKLGESMAGAAKSVAAEKIAGLLRKGVLIE